MQNPALRTVTGCTQDTNICMKKHLHFPYTSTYRSTPHNSNRKHNIHNILYTNLQHTSILQGKNHYIQQRTLHNKHHHTITTTDLNKILRTPALNISSSEEIFPRITHRILAQLRTSKSPFLKSYIHKVDAKITSSTTMPPL